ncbi:MAG: TonB-dependent receptor plug domain-containing protein [Myxococcales bacterium]|nr:TonB-dependent receptor plug domain-containing protein [Myxococcales bacterium]
MTEGKRLLARRHNLVASRTSVRRRARSALVRAALGPAALLSLLSFVQLAAAQPESETGSAKPTAPLATAPKATPAVEQQPESGDEPAPPPEVEKPIEVVVHGERVEPAGTSLSRAEVRQLPGAFGDPFRAIEALPGVTPIASGVPFFYVRGAPPGNVGYFLDGVRVPYLYHIGLGPSVIHPAIVQRVNFYPGGYPARFGRYAGGIVAADVTEPRSDLHGEGNLRLFDVGAVVESGFADGRGTVLLGGRYSYTGTLLSLIVPEIKLEYRDYQARASYDLGPRDRVSVFSFGAYDLLGEPKDRGLDVLFASEFYRVDLRYDHFFSRDSSLRYAVTFGYDQTRLAEYRNGHDKMVGSRVEVVHRAGDGVMLRGGADLTVDAYGASNLEYEDPDSPDLARKNALFPERNDLALGGYVDVVFEPTPELELTPGVRLDLYGSVGAAVLAVDPRLAAVFHVSRAVRIIHAYGLVHQPPSFFGPIPGLTPGTLANGLQTSFQTSAGVEVDLPEDVTAGTTLFHNAFFNLTDTLAVSSGEFDLTSDRRTTGDAAGLELFVRRKFTRRLGGFLSYTLSRSSRSVGREKFPSAFDRTHVANAAVGYDLGRRWRAGTRVVFYTGTPKTYPSNGLIVPLRPRAPDRGPAFYRVDLRIEKRWPLAKSAWLSFVGEVMNATLSKETFASGTGADTTIGPVTIPSIGLEGGF